MPKSEKKKSQKKNLTNQKTVVRLNHEKIFEGYNRCVGVACRGPD